MNPENLNMWNQHMEVDGSNDVPLRDDFQVNEPLVFGGVSTTNHHARQIGVISQGSG